MVALGLFWGIGGCSGVVLGLRMVVHKAVDLDYMEVVVLE
jgi:hypothetical protein